MISMESFKERTAHRNIYGLLNGMSLGQEYGTAMESVVRVVYDDRGSSPRLRIHLFFKILKIYVKNGHTKDRR